MAMVCSFLVDFAEVLPSGFTNLYSHQKYMREFQLFHMFVNTWYCQSLFLVFLEGCVVVLHCSFDFIFR